VLAMNDPCPVCGLLFEREEGYFLGAMYVSYALSSAVLAALFFVVAALLPTWRSVPVALVAIALYLPLMPLVFRYSRVVWIYYDRAIDPGTALAGSYEKRRLRETGTPPKADRLTRSANGRQACNGEHGQQPR
jgi:hypothetical protein